MSSVGHLVGYAAGSVDLVEALGPALGGTQFQQLTVLAAAVMVASTLVTCWAVSERALVAPAAGAGRKSIARVLRQILATLRHLPPRVQGICWAQFWSWIGWFPFLFYNTTWLGEMYFRYDAPRDGHQPSRDALGDMGRVGSTALFVYSCITLAAAFLLPLLVRAPDDGAEASPPRPPRAVAGFFKSLGDRKPDLLTTWVCGHTLFAAAMSIAPLARSFRFATFLVCLCGL